MPPCSVRRYAGGHPVRQPALDRVRDRPDLCLSVTGCDSRTWTSRDGPCFDGEAVVASVPMTSCGTWLPSANSQAAATRSFDVVCDVTSRERLAWARPPGSWCGPSSSARSGGVTRAMALGADSRGWEHGLEAARTGARGIAEGATPLPGWHWWPAFLVRHWDAPGAPRGGSFVAAMGPTSQGCAGWPGALEQRTGFLSWGNCHVPKY